MASRRPLHVRHEPRERKALRQIETQRIERGEAARDGVDDRLRVVRTMAEPMGETSP